MASCQAMKGCSEGWPAASSGELGDDTHVTVVCFLSETAFCVSTSISLQPYPLALFRAAWRLLEMGMSGAFSWSEVLQPVAAELLDMCDLLPRGL